MNVLQTTTLALAATMLVGCAYGFMGRHTMTGEVTNIDNQKGMFSLKTKEGTLDLHAPPSALQGVKRGDQVAVEIAVKPMK
jgi:hypothetical protein